jgi:HAD superfamily hydrolase (TIGR01490 family)
MTLHLFDFDGTISNADSMFKFLKTLHKKYYFYFLLVKCTPLLIKYHFNIISKTSYKEKFLLIFLSQFSKNHLLARSSQFAISFQKHLKHSAISHIENLKEKKDNEICIVSASLDIWIKPIAKKLNVNSITTLSKYNNSLFSGIHGENCWGEEKVSRIKELYDIEGFDEIYVYGDSTGDLQMLEIATQKRFKFFT